MPQIHPLAIVSPSCRLGVNVTIGPFCEIQADVEIGDNCQLASRVVIKSGTRLGRDNQVWEGAVLGGRPQHLRAGETTGRLTIGDGNVIRENVTMHTALAPRDSTVVGNGNLFMVNSHIGHDVRVGSQAIFVNNVMLGGHVVVEDRAFLGGAAAVHQFCRIGRLAMVGGQAHVVQDVPPFVTVDGLTSRIVGLNLVGLRRAGFSADEIAQLKTAYRLIYRQGLTWKESLAALAEAFPSGPAAEFVPFFSQGKRGFIPERRTPSSATVRLKNPAAIPDDPHADEDDRFRRIG